MRMDKRVFFLSLAMVGFLTFSFGKGGKKAKKEIGKFLYINGGALIDDETRVPINNFYIFKTEVTNLDYREFLYDLKKNHPEQYKTAIYDSTAWRNPGDSGYYEALEQLYFNHEAYENHPIINLTKQAAEMYCSWLEERLKEGYLKEADFTFKVRLPTQQEWMYAASGGFTLFQYAWGGYDLFDKKGRPKCVFSNYSANNISFNYDTKQYEIINKRNRVLGPVFQPAATANYKANGYGLFDVCGNVAEMVSDKNVAMGGHWMSLGGDVRIKSEMPYDGQPNKFVGFRPVLEIINQ